MIEIRELRKSYGETVALRGISASIQRGEIVGLLGPNGAGKTTTMKILVGYLHPSSGSATVAGFDVARDPIEVRKRLGYLPENAPLYLDMLVQDYLMFTANVRDISGGAARASIRDAVEQCNIGNVLARPIGELSKGYRQRVGLASTILHDPEILILDEPTNGLDPNQIVEVRELIRHLGRSKTVIVSTHILPEVEATCDRAIIIIDGSIRVDGKLADITRASVQTVTVAADASDARRAFEATPNVSRVEYVGKSADRFHTFRLHIDGDDDIADEVWKTCNEQQWPVRELRRDDRTLEQVFRELTETTVEVLA
jgi:ABC-2 type transport system ATP-binding protein